MQLTNLDALNAAAALDELTAVRCDAKTALKLARMARAVNLLRTDIETVRERLIKQAAPDAAAGDTVTVTPDMAAEWAALMGEPVEYAGPVLTEDEVEKFGSVTPQTLVWLAPLIVEGGNA